MSFAPSRNKFQFQAKIQYNNLTQYPIPKWSISLGIIIEIMLPIIVNISPTSGHFSSAEGGSWAHSIEISWPRWNAWNGFSTKQAFEF